MHRLLFGTPIALAVTASFFAACNSSSGGGGPGANFDSGAADTTFAEPDGGGDEASIDAPAVDSTASNDTGTAVVDSGTGGADTGTPGLDSGTPAPDASAPADSGSPVDAGVDASATDAGNTCSQVQGTYQATAVACNGTPINIASITWILTVNGSSASFSEAVLGGCALISSGTVACVGADMDLLWSNPNTCNPTGCAMWGAQCTATPNEILDWATSDFTATTFLATSLNEPDGGPTPLTTCTSQGLSNPIQITWTKM